MKKKNLLLTAIAIFVLATITMAQSVPSYVPTNGLVGWWPFNGNANDESGNGNNGTVNGSSLSSDRFGNSSSSALFGSNTSQYISANIGLQDTLTFSFWYKCDIQSKYYPTFVDYGNTSGVAINNRYIMHMAGDEPTWINTFSGRAYNQTNLGGIGVQDTALTANVQWHQMVNVYVPNDSVYLYVDGVRIGADFLGAVSITSGTLFFGRDITDNAGACNACGRYDGLLDDIGIWNRALTQQEITDLYNGNICYQTITVTDTLLINMGITGFNPVTYNNTIKIFPNPTNDHITIDYGNFTSVSGYQLKIMNSLSRQVFQTNITQQSNYLNLTTWGGNGLYFVQIIDPQGNIIDIRKIVLQ